MAWWLTPALIGGAMFYLKSKASAPAKWFKGMEADAKKLPVAVLLTKVETGETLPAPPAGFRWKPLLMTVAPSPFAMPQDIEINVLESEAQTTPAAGTSAFLTEQQMQGISGVGWIEYHLTKEALQEPLHPAPTVQLAAMGGKADEAIRRLSEELRQSGRAVMPVAPQDAAQGDFVVTRCCKLYVIERGPMGFPASYDLREMHPSKGARRRVTLADIRCAFGVRKAGLTA